LPRVPGSGQDRRAAPRPASRRSGGRRDDARGRGAFDHGRGGGDGGLNPAPQRTKVALVTGALGGIGHATVAAFTDAGYEVVGADQKLGADIVADLSTDGGARAAVGE